MNFFTKTLLVTAVIAAALCFYTPASRADYGDAPWCAVVSVGTGNVIWDCRFRTVEECVPNVLGGNRGFCNPNPWYAPGTVALKKRRTAHSHRN
jgi:hypothetical protein